MTQDRTKKKIMADRGLENPLFFEKYALTSFKLPLGDSMIYKIIV